VLSLELGAGAMVDGYKIGIFQEEARRLPTRWTRSEAKSALSVLSTASHFPCRK
jgi:hypothetical protein